MAQPKGYVNSDFPDHVCSLKKAIYGLKQAPRAWYEALTAYLNTIGFVKSESDASLFIFKSLAVTVYILVYVDDILITGNHPNLVAQVINSLASRFSLKNLGELNYFLGIDVKRVPNGIILSQSQYILEILSDVDMTDCKGVATPMCSSSPPKADDGSPPADATLYRRTLGKLQYLSFTRPDISFAVNKLSQFMHSPSLEHWKAVKRVLRYLKSTTTSCLEIRHHADRNLYMYADADWAGDPSDRISTSGHMLFLGPNPISWSSRKQQSVARSSTEAEYKSVANALAELTWVQNLLDELRYHISNTPSIFCDNIGVSYLSKNPVFHTKMKHIAVDFHYLRNSVNSGKVTVKYLPSIDQVADTLTKPLPKPAFLRCLTKLGVVAPHLT
ncbi:uncharacterized mitochondrial protein AtMg00810-like [Solanum tuberosum]|uniref:uncharacterized mitochondrial protein AtMg00810-like n=1 Tax=Solanum tuberosum TaxID=4113 RepID=UPI00073A4A51|nr:PREDICTED: uncharacterized mitochondrial protein AtMg00810-like [Solanum tuberosum]